MLRDGHRSMAKAAGMHGIVGEGDSVGDTFQTIITGDVAVTDGKSLPWAPSSPPGASKLPNGPILHPTQPDAPQGQPSLFRRILPYLVAAALAAGSGGAGIGLGKWLSSGTTTTRGIGSVLNLIEDPGPSVPRPAPRPSGP
jgi:hypothetical protein